VACNRIWKLNSIWWRSKCKEKKEDWLEEEGKRVLLNFKAKLFLTMAFSREEFDRIQECDTAKEIWDTLKIHHEGNRNNRW